MGYTASVEGLTYCRGCKGNCGLKDAYDICSSGVDPTTYTFDREFITSSFGYSEYSEALTIFVTKVIISCSDPVSSNEGYFIAIVAD